MRAAIFVLLMFSLTTPAIAQDSFEQLRADALRIPNATVRELPDLTIVLEQSGLAFHYFTKLGHFAHPGAIKRYAVQKGGAWYIRYDARSFGPDSQQGEFQRWLAQFRELDRQFADYLKRQNNNSRQ